MPRSFFPVISSSYLGMAMAARMHGAGIKLLSFALTGMLTVGTTTALAQEESAKASLEKVRPRQHVNADPRLSHLDATSFSDLPVCADPGSKCGPPVLFAHGICDHPSSWDEIRLSLAAYLSTNEGALYRDPQLYFVVAAGATLDEVQFYDFSGNPVTPPPQARFFAIGFLDPFQPYSSPETFNPVNVMDRSIRLKADELALAIGKIKEITGSPKVAIVAHSMGGLDARAYIENLGEDPSLMSHQIGLDTDVVSLTTLDTPHMGSPLAALSSYIPWSPWQQCIAESSTNIDELAPDSTLLESLNYKDGYASDIPHTVEIDALVNYNPGTSIIYPFTVYGMEDPLIGSFGQGKYGDGAVSRYSQRIDNALAAYPFNPKPSAQSFETPLDIACPSTDFWPGILHSLSCIGSQDGLQTQLKATVITHLLTNSIEVTPDSVQLALGNKQSFTFTQNQTPVAAYATLLESPASTMVNSDGLFTASAPGTWHVVATDKATGLQYGMATVTVTASGQKATLGVNFAGSGTGGVTSSPQGISCRSNCSFDFALDTQATLTAWPDTGMTVAGWQNCDEVSGNSCMLSLTTGKQVTVTLATAQSLRLPAPVLNPAQLGGTAQQPTVAFSWSQVAHNTGYRIQVASVPAALSASADSGACNGSCAINLTVAAGMPAYTSQPGELQPGMTYYWQAHALAGTGYLPGSWSAAGSFSTAQAQGQVQVTMQGSGAGRVTSMPAGINCPGTCSANFAPNTQVTLTQSTNTGSQFAGWGGACGGATCSVTATGVQTVFANFNLVSNYTLTLAVAGSGTVTSGDGTLACGNQGGKCSASYASGTTVQLSAAPGTYYTLGTWSGACSGSGTCRVNMSQNQEVTAVFNLSSQPNGKLVSNIASLAPVFNQGGRPDFIGLLVTNSSGGPMVGTATVAEQSGGAWMTVNGSAKYSFGAPETMTVGFDPAGLSAGVYTGSITLASSQATNSPVVVPVSLTVLTPLLITTPAALPDAFAGKSYSTSLQATGGVGLKWTLEDGALPLGLTLDSATGVISGIPGAIAGDSPTNFNIQVTDSHGRLTWQAFTMNWRQGVTVMLWDNSLLQLIVGNPLYQKAGANFIATGGTGPYSWSATGLPPGVSLSTDGVFSGSPTARGQYDMVLTATDSTGLSGSLDITVTTSEILLQINDYLNQTPAVLKPIVAGTELTSTYVTASGGTQSGYVWTTQGSLPDGVYAGTSPECTVSTCALMFTGAPTKAGTFPFTIQVQDSDGNTAVSRQVWIVNADGNGPKISTSELGQATVGAAYSAQLAASGGKGAQTWTLVPELSSVFDPGLSLSAGGLLHGTASIPNECSLGGGLAPQGAIPNKFVVKVTDANGESDLQQLCITDYFPQPSVEQVTPQTIVSDGGAKTLTVKGTNFQPQSQVWVQYTQQPTVYVSPTELQFTMEPGKHEPFNLANGIGLPPANWPMRVQAPYTMPSGWSSFHVALAAPTIASIEESYGNTGAPCTPNFSCEFTVNGTGFAYESAFTVLNSTQTLTVLQAPDALEPWAQISVGFFIPPAEGDYALQVSNSNQANGGTATGSGVFHVYQDGTIVPQPAALSRTFTQGDAAATAGLLVQVAGIPSLTGSFTASTQNGRAWLTVAGGTSGSWNAGQTLAVGLNPAGLTPGTYTGSIVLNWQNAVGGPVTVPVTITVASPLQILSPVILPLATNGQAYSFALTAAGGSGFQWSVASGSLPTGLTLGTDGTIGGVPAVSGGMVMDGFSVLLKDSLGRTVTAAFSMSVRSAPQITAQPSNQTVNPGQAAQFSVSVTGTPAPAIQWQAWNGSAWADFQGGVGAASCNVTIPAVSLTQSGLQLRAVADNGVGQPAISGQAILTVRPPAATVQFSPPAGTYTTAQKVTLNDATSGATIHYTVDGSAPGAGSPVYSGPVPVAKTTTIRAMATAPDHSSGAASLAVYTIEPPIHWTAPAAITYGMALSKTQLDATIPIPGMFAYSPELGWVLTAGKHTLEATFTPTDSRYLKLTATVEIAVNKAPLTVQADNKSMEYGAAIPVLTGKLTGVVKGDSITAAYSTTATKASPVGKYPIVAALKDPAARLANYNVSNTPAVLTIAKATPRLAVKAVVSTYGSAYADVVVALAYGAGKSPVSTPVVVLVDQTLSAVAACTGLNSPLTCTAHVAANRLPAGSHTVTATFAGNSLYNPASAVGTLTIAKRTPGISVTPLSIQSGATPTTLTAKVAFGMGAVPTPAPGFKVDAGPTVTATCKGTASPIVCTAKYSTGSLAVGRHTMTVTFAGGKDYNSAQGTSTLTVTKP